MPEFEWSWSVEPDNESLAGACPSWMSHEDFHTLAEGYVKSMMWCNTMDHSDETNELEFVSVGDGDQLQIRTLEDAAKDVADFVSANHENCKKLMQELDEGWGCIGHNFALSRNGHGAGFFDSGATVADEMQEASKPYGECTWYVYDEGTLDDGTVGL